MELRDRAWDDRGMESAGEGRSFAPGLRSAPDDAIPHRRLVIGDGFREVGGPGAAPTPAPDAVGGARGETAIQFGRFSLLIRRRELLADGACLNLGSRALEVLMVLIERGGELVTKDELLSRVWPTTTVEENCLQFQVSTLRKALGADRDVIRTVSGRGYRFVAETSVGVLVPGAFACRLEPRHDPAIDSTSPVSPDRGGLPAPMSELVGRDVLLAEVGSRVTENRLVTLVGPGGVGKTRLAIELARRLAPQFEAGVWFVDLGSLSDAALIPSAIGSAIGLDGRAVSPKVLAARLGQGPGLMVLDNCEHLLDAVAATVEALLGAHDALRVVATSRQPLRADAEWVCRVPALALPSPGSEELTELLASSAVKLFVARARAADPGLTIHPRTAVAAAEICRHLDGFPLAIELAAATAAALGVEGLAAHVEDLLVLLTDGRRTAPARHRTLRATLDWSYDLLPDLEQAVLRRLAVFGGDFTMDQASLVVGGAGFGPGDILPGVANLVAKSLVVRDDTGPIPMFRLFETTRAYARAKVVECGEGDDPATGWAGAPVVAGLERTPPPRVVRRTILREVAAPSSDARLEP